MAELADALDLGSSGATRKSSTLFTRTTLRPVGFGWQATLFFRPVGFGWQATFFLALWASWCRHHHHRQAIKKYLICRKKTIEYDTQ